MTNKKSGIAKSVVTAAVLKKRPVIKKAKVRYSTHFRRPKTLSLPRNPKCPSRAVPRLPSMDEYRVIRCPMTTESAIKKIEVNNTLVFLCDPLASKPQIRRAVLKLYNVKARQVNTLIRPDGVKKAFVSLPQDHDAVDVAHKMGII